MTTMMQRQTPLISKYAENGYLAAVLNLFSRKIVGWSLDTHMREDLIMGAFTMAAHNRNIPDNAFNPGSFGFGRAYDN